MNLSYYGELAIKSTFQPLPLCVVAPLPRNLNEGKGKIVRVCTLILFVAELILGLLPTLLNLVCMWG